MVWHSVSSPEGDQGSTRFRGWPGEGGEAENTDCQGKLSVEKNHKEKTDEI